MFRPPFATAACFARRVRHKLKDGVLGKRAGRDAAVRNFELVEDIGIESDAAVHAARNERAHVHDEHDSRGIVRIGEREDIGNVREGVGNDGR